MASDLAGMCGIYCGDCVFRKGNNCQGCRQMKGRMFWGTCEVAACCLQKELNSCGSCSGFPCGTLTAYAHHPEHGDNGERIANLETWQAVGFETWLKQRAGDHQSKA